MASTISFSPLDACLLSNGHYSVFLTSAGSGYSAVDGIDVTRWREDVTCNCWGQYYYIRDLEEGRVWSAGRQPIGGTGEDYSAELRPDLATFRRCDGEIETRCEIAVVPDANAEVRRITLANNGDKTRTVEVTSYAEVALNPRRTDEAHPAFAKLFLETEYLRTPAALLCRRRPRARDQQPIWALHVLADPGEADDTACGDVQFETDRARFLGRGRSARNPAALDADVTLSRTQGPVLDPVFSLRRRIVLGPGSSTALAFTTAMPENRDQALALAHRFSDLKSVDRVIDEAASNWPARLAALELTPHDAALFQFLASHVVLTRPLLRSPSSVADNKRGQASLWPHGISGDVPIALLRIAADNGLELTRQLLQAHKYWRWCGLVADLVMLNDAGPDLREQIDSLVQNSPARELINKPGGIFLLDAANLSPDDNTLLEAAARIILHGKDGNLAEQLSRAPTARQVGDTSPAASNDTHRRPLASSMHSASATAGEQLLFDNGNGGFTRDGSEYVIALSGDERPPAPWTNVLANPDFGCLVTEAGGGYTWAGNSQMNRLTPWSNDPVSDPPGEVIYLRDDETGAYWTPTPAPSGGDSATIVRHGQGYTRFTQTSHGLEQDLFILVSPVEPVKLFHLRVKNPGDRPRRMSAVFYVEWVVGIQRDQAPMQVGCTVDQESGALFAVSAWAGDFAGRVAFADVSRRPRSFTTDRLEFLGREGTTASPHALTREQLSNRSAELPDPCAAIMTRMEVPPGETQEIVFVLGQAVSPEESRRLVRVYADPVRAQMTLAEVRALWDGILGSVQVRTPDPAFDLMLNRWLLYQTLACRMWGRSGLYQSGGAFGFRDQLQDSMALVWSSPKETRAQIVRAAARQFEEGDVQHWWHPPAGRGVRTRITDDLYFLPLVTCHYVRVSGDATVLDEPVPFLHSPVLRPDQEEDYCLPAVSDRTAALYEHCVRALEYGLKLGAHGIPLMGTGDWNDGMNKVGAHGRGESIWNGWFMATTLQDFAVMADSRGDTARAAWCRERAEALRASLEEHAWDGQWYRRAYFDDGTPLGSATNDECQIDSIAQSWAVISAAADPVRTRQAMEAVQQRLVRTSDRLILLFDPPFDKGVLEPGYIKGYVPGIRENGGQYTHAATWVVLATALLGQGERAAELFGLLNPIHHADLPEKVARYKVEPYVVAADVYGRPPHTGRGGWTWYTGSAAWLYRVGLEAILGFHQRGNRLEIKPCVPPDWPSYEITWHYRSATYHVVVDNGSGSGGGVHSLMVDGHAVPTGAIDLADDGQRHEVRLTTASCSGEELVHAAG
jgi:cyclic beta-1,2-glucan synthetase